MSPNRRANPEQRMALLDHVGELRRRLVLAVAGIAAGTVVGWFCFDPVMGFLQRPLRDFAGADTQLNFQTIGAAFDPRVTVAVWIGVLVSSPWWILQMALFVGPGLRRTERIHVAAFGGAGILLFLLGAFSGVLVVPKAVEVLLTFVPDGAATLLRADAFVSFSMRVVLAFGLSFLVPEVLVGLGFTGVLRARDMMAAWRWVVVVCFTFAAVVNPLPSPVPMIIQALALVALYLGGVGICSWHERRVNRARTGAATPSGTSADGT